MGGWKGWKIRGRKRFDRTLFNYRLMNRISFIPAGRMRVNYFLWLIRAASVITMKRTFSKKTIRACLRGGGGHWLRNLMRNSMNGNLQFTPRALSENESVFRRCKTLIGHGLDSRGSRPWRMWRNLFIPFIPRQIKPCYRERRNKLCKPGSS